MQGSKKCQCLYSEGRVPGYGDRHAKPGVRRVLSSSGSGETSVLKKNHCVASREVAPALHVCAGVEKGLSSRCNSKEWAQAASRVYIHRSQNLNDWDQARL
jgi:hypothetical protein